MALYLHDKVPGITIPKPLQDAMADGGRDTGIAIAADTVKALQEMGAAGVHLLPINDVPAVGEIARQAGMSPKQL